MCEAREASLLLFWFAANSSQVLVAVSRNVSDDIQPHN